MKGVCKTAFIISGEGNPEYIEERLGLQSCGKIESGGCFTLEFCACEEYDAYIYKMMEKTVGALEGKKEVLKQLKKEHSLYFALAVFPEIEHKVYGEEGQYSTVTPCLSPSLKVMRFLVEVGAELDIDYTLV